MGAKLMEFFSQAQKLGGIKGKMRLAMITRISSAQAGSQPDSPENIRKFTAALNEIKKNLNKEDEYGCI